MTSPKNSAVTIPRWLLIVIACGAAAAVIISVVVVVVAGGSDDADSQAASETTTQVEAVDYDDVELPSLPYTEVAAWSSQRVDMEGGNVPEGTIFTNPDSNPSWMKVNRFTGEVTYAPQAKRIQYRPYDVVIDVEFPDGQTSQITGTVEVNDGGFREEQEKKEREEAENTPVLPAIEVRAGDKVTVSLENNNLPEETRYSKRSGPPWMWVDRETGDVTYHLVEEAVVAYPLERLSAGVVALIPGEEGEDALADPTAEQFFISSTVEVVE